MSTFHGYCDDTGTFTLDPIERKKFAAFVRRWKGEELSIDVYRRRTKRTDRQNKYLHAALTGWARELGYDIEDLKDALLEQVFGLKEVPNPLTGEIRTVLAEPHTSHLDTRKFTELVERMVEIAAGTGYLIELPDEFKQRKAKEARRAA